MAAFPRGGKAPPAATGLSSRIHGGVIAPGLTKPGTSHRRQKRMGPAPFASFEDLSDELESPEDKNATNVVRLPGIREDATPCSPAPGEIRAEFIYTGISLIGAASTPTVAGRSPTSPTGEQPTTTSTKNTLTPRIDISRASSSSHHDSKDSTPDRDDVVRIGLEEGAVDLRSSTEEMEFAGADESSKPSSKTTTTTHHQQHQPPPAQQPPPPPPPRIHSPHHHHDHQPHEVDSYHSHNRKDSQSSELGLLCISGRTSRLSSIGSQGSAHSRVSNASHLSVVSGASRSPSPHKMLLETSFCGTKPKRGQLSIDLFEGKDQDEGTKELERALLQRVHDPTQVLMAEGVDITPLSPKSITRSSIVHEPEVIIRQAPIQSPPYREPPRDLRKVVSPPVVSSTAIPKPKALSRPLDKVTIKIDKAAPVEETTDDVQRPKLPKHIVSDSGTEFIYIPLKGPLPEDPPGYVDTSSHPTNGMHTKTKVRETKSAGGISSRDGKDREKRKSKSASPSPAMTRHYQSAGPSQGHRASADEPKYIRIRLKPDHLYDDFDPNARTETPTDVHKPETLNLQSKFDEITVSLGQPQTVPVKTRYLTHESPKHKSPSPSLSRKSSFASIFKSRETISPESPTPAGRKTRATKETQSRRSRSKSRDRGGGGGRSSTESIDSKGRSMFSLFSKPRKASSRQSLDRSPGPDLPNLENLAQNIQNTSKSKRSHYESPLQAESVRIPLHSPTYYESKSFFESFKTSSQDSQETVIEVKTNNKQKSDQHEDGITTIVASGTVRQSSTSSENIVFSTKLGSNNDIFSTKLPKHQEIIETTTAIVEYVKERVTSDDEDFLTKHIRRTSEEIKGKVETPQSSEEKTAEVRDHAERRMSSSASNDSRKLFRLEKTRRIEASEQFPVVATISLSQSTSSSYYIPRSEEVEQVEAEPVEPTMASSPISPVSIRTSVSRDSSREKPPLREQSSDDIPIIAKEKEKLKLQELKNMKRSEDHYSSESERETDFDRREVKPKPEEALQEMEPERKGLVLQQDSFEDELPYIPTTLPQERSMAVPIIPVKQRSSIDVRTCTIERPRSTTPIKPTLEVYREAERSQRVSKAEKLKISLPKQDDVQPKIKSPRRKFSDAEQSVFSAPISSQGNWFDFSRAERPSTSGEDKPPPLPPKGMQKEWINFEEIPEKRKPPKRIQTIPSRGNIEVPESLVQAQENVIYTYVNPEDCKCECHERPLRQPPPPPAPPPKHGQKQEHAEHCHQHRQDLRGEEVEEEVIREDEMPLLDDDEEERERERDRDRLKPDNRSVISDSSVDLSTASHAHEETANGTTRTGVGTLHTPFTSDLGVSSAGHSNRSSIISQDDQTRTPD